MEQNRRAESPDEQETELVDEPVEIDPATGYTITRLPTVYLDDMDPSVKKLLSSHIGSQDTVPVLSKSDGLRRGRKLRKEDSDFKQDR